MQARALLLTFALACGCAFAGAPDKLGRVAGAQPTKDQARDAVIEDLKRNVTSGRDFERVRFFSGPHLVTGTNYADGREQAWMMCVVQGNSDVRRSPLDLQLKPYLLRSDAGKVTVVALSNWAEFDYSC